MRMEEGESPAIPESLAVSHGRSAASRAIQSAMRSSEMAKPTRQTQESHGGIHLVQVSQRASCSVMEARRTHQMENKTPVPAAG